MNDDKLVRLIDEKLDNELDAIVFTSIEQEEVIKRLKKKSWISRLLNHEIQISFNKLIMGISVIGFAVVFLSYQAFRLTPENLQDCQIEYIEIMADR